jgi:glycosyltransferase involved in cell wall biosynthesis
MRILFFIGSLGSGGKERRLVELLSYLKRLQHYEMLVVLAFNSSIDYPHFLDLGINYLCLNKRANNKNVQIFFELYKICKKFSPDIIHTWGAMQTFYMIPTAILRRMPLVNNQITDAPVRLECDIFSRFVNTINFRFSSVNLANSQAGLNAYGIDKSKKSRVIYNGLRMERFEGLADKKAIKSKYKIMTAYAAVMSASFSNNKDWNRFYKVAEYVTNKDSDITFVGVGRVVDQKLFDEIFSLSVFKEHIIFPGFISEVENLVNACDVGILLSTNGEGVSNSILEYMALGKPVVVDECGGTPEFVRESENGFFATRRTVEHTGDLIIELCHNQELRDTIGAKGKETIQNTFTIEKMGNEFEKIYHTLTNK